LVTPRSSPCPDSAASTTRYEWRAAA
jgi:hypothetical protein